MVKTEGKITRKIQIYTVSQKTVKIVFIRT